MNHPHRAALAAALLIPLLLAGCGNKGPLYLPGPDGAPPPAVAADATD